MSSQDKQSEERQIEVPLTDVERRVLVRGMNDWGGPTNCTPELAISMGFTSIESLYTEAMRIGRQLKIADSLTRDDWVRALLASEMCFASSFGSTIDWEITTGLRDVETIDAIRSLQRKLGPMVSAFSGPQERILSRHVSPWDLRNMTMWIEAEEVADIDDVSNVLVSLKDGRKWGLNVWTYAFFEQARTQDELTASPELARTYMQPPDLFVADLSRSTLEPVIEDILAAGVPSHWELAHP